MGFRVFNIRFSYTDGVELLSKKSPEISAWKIRQEVVFLTLFLSLYDGEKICTHPVMLFLILAQTTDCQHLYRGLKKVQIHGRNMPQMNFAFHAHLQSFLLSRKNEMFYALLYQ